MEKIKTIFEWLDQDDNKARMGWCLLALALVTGLLAIWFESGRMGATAGMFFVVSSILAMIADF